MTPREQGHDAAIAVAKTAPAAAVSLATTVGGLSLNDWVLIATLVYIVLQMGWLLVKAVWAIRDRRAKREREESESDDGPNWV